MHHALALNGAIKKFRNFTLGPVDLQVETGTSVALVGANGSGKSTLFRSLMQLLQLDQGRIEMFGEELKRDETALKSQIGYAGAGLLQVFGHLTIRELAKHISYWYADWDAWHYAELIERYGIAEGEKLQKCSTGTQKKVEFIFALSHHPRLLLLDEPTAGVDLIGQQNMTEDIIRYMENEQNSVFMATHSIEEVKRICDYICVLHQGQILTMFDKDEIHGRWARLWVSHLPAGLLQNPHVVSAESMRGRAGESTEKRVSEVAVDSTVERVGEFATSVAADSAPAQLVTDRLDLIEQHLAAEGIAITHRQQLDLDEVITLLIQTKK